MTGEVADVLSRKLQTEVEIGDMEVGLFNRIVLHDVLLRDRQGRALLESGKMSAKVAVRPLLEGEVNLRSVSLLDTRIRLYQDRADSAANFQFLIDAFSTEDKEEPSALNLHIGSLILRRCAVSYDDVAAQPTPGRFNPKHLNVSNLDTNISLRRLTPDSLNLRIRSLALQEQSGLDIRQLTMQLAANRQHCEITELDLTLPASHLAQPHIALYYDATSPERIAQSLRIHGTIDKARFSTADAVCFMPALRGMERSISLSTDYLIHPTRIALNNLDLQESQGALALRGNAVLERDAGKPVAANADIRSFAITNAFAADIFRTIAGKPLPKPLASLGDVTYQGSLHYATNGRMAANGRLTSAAGNVSGQVEKLGNAISGRLRGEHIRLAALTGNSNLPTDLHAAVSGKADWSNPKRPDIRANVEVEQMLLQGHTFRDIALNGSWRGGQLSANIYSADPEARINGQLSGIFDGKTLSQLTLDADVARIVPSAFGLGGEYAQSVFAGQIQATLPGLLPDVRHPYGELRLNDFSMAGGEEPLHLDGLHIAVSPSGEGGRIDMECDFATVHFDGPLSPTLLRDAAEKVVARCLPGFLPQRPHATEEHEWKVRAEIRSTDFLQRLTKLPLNLAAPLTVEGNLRSDGGRTAFVASTEGLTYDGVEVKNASVYINGEGDRLNALIQGVKEVGEADMKLVLRAMTEEGHLFTNLSWAGEGTPRFTGSLSANSHYGHDRPDEFHTHILPSEITIGDSVWNVEAGDLTYTDNSLAIEGFEIAHADQSLKVDGRLSPNPADSIVATLQKVNIEYVLGLVDFDAVDFAGQATGTISLDKRDGYPKVRAKLDVPDFHFNQGPMGNLHLLGGFDTQEKRIDLDGHMVNPDTGWTDVKGYVSLLHKGLDLNITSENTNLRFLNRYIETIFDDFQGRATGYCHLFGPFKQLDFEGDERASAQATIHATGASYHIYDGHVNISPGIFAFEGFNVADRANGKGRVSGKLQHDHLENLRYKFDLDADHLLVYDKGKEVDMPFYSTASGTGKMTLQGSPGMFEADIRMRPERGTTLVYTVDAPETFGDVSLLAFHDKTPRPIAEIETTSIPTTPEEEEEGTTDVRLNMLFDLNPDAALKVIMDEKSGDNIIVRGSGPIRASWYNKGAFRMYGTLNIEEGSYKMSIQDAIRKDFSLTKGGRIVFGGDPFEGDLDMQAVYTVNSASLSDLNIGGSFSQSSVRVNCLLNFSGKVKQPEVSFDLDLPTVNEDEKQMVRNLISTEEDMTTQVLYLLGIGRFYTYNGMQAGTELTAGAQSSAAMKSFLSSTLSSQLNQIISDAVGSSNWTFGANVSTGSAGTNDMEVEGLLSGRLFNNRLLVNGNIGYRDNTYYSTNFIGDFDVRYLLTPKGSVSLKAYSETNDRYFTKSSLTTQGIGVQLSRDFTNLRDLFNAKKKKKRSKKKK